MLLQAGQEQLLSAAFEQSFVIGLLTVLLIVCGLYIRQLGKEKNEVQASKDKVVEESLGIINLVEVQLIDNKTSNDKMLASQTEILTQLQLFKQLYESDKKN